MSAALVLGPEPRRECVADARIQLVASPDARRMDFTPLHDYPRGAALDRVSMADILRNSFVYPPHSIYRDVKVAISGFEPGQDLHAQPRFHFPYQSCAAPGRPAMPAVDPGRLLGQYHQRLSAAVSRASATMHAPWLLQSGGKDSTSVAIALAEARPDATCITYLGGREENEVDSAQLIARRLGLRHEALVCDPGRAYDRYLAMVPDMPLLTADFAMLAYADLVTEIAAAGGDGVLDALGSDTYFGLPLHWQQLLRVVLARRVPVPDAVLRHPLVRRNFRLSYALGSLQMDRFERAFPGSRFTDREVDALLGPGMSARSRQRLDIFRADLAEAHSLEAKRRVAAAVVEAATFGKGMYTASAVGLQLAYPYCDTRLCEWIFHEVPDALLIGRGGVNKVLVRRHIAQHFRQLPYVKSKGSFRFDVCGLAARFDQVHAFAQQARDVLPGAVDWLVCHRNQLDNKYFGSKFYLLAVLLPWLLSRMNHAGDSTTTLSGG